MSIQEVEGDLGDKAPSIGIVVSKWNSFITGRLKEGAFKALRNHGIDEKRITVVWCPGSYEIPITARKMLEKGGFDALICLGVVIRGGTPHFDYVAGSVNQGITQLMADFSIPVSFGVLTTDNRQQAIDRSGLKSGNKGEEAALAAIEMASVVRRINDL